MLNHAVFSRGDKDSRYSAQPLWGNRLSQESLRAKPASNNSAAGAARRTKTLSSSRPAPAVGKSEDEVYQLVTMT